LAETDRDERLVVKDAPAEFDGRGITEPVQYEEIEKDDEIGDYKHLGKIRFLPQGIK
jgi:hypothetical protein